MRLLSPVLLVTVGLIGCAATPQSASAGDRKPDIPRILQMLDENGDGVISRAEYDDVRNKSFVRLDRNSDGYLDREDASGRFLVRFSSNGSRLAQAMALLDRNGDNRISREEFMTGTSPFFDRADTNHDGVVDESEFEAFRTVLAARRGP